MGPDAQEKWRQLPAMGSVVSVWLTTQRSEVWCGWLIRSHRGKTQFHLRFSFFFLPFFSFDCQNEVKCLFCCACVIFSPFPGHSMPLNLFEHHHSCYVDCQCAVSVMVLHGVAVLKCTEMTQSYSFYWISISHNSLYTRYTWIKMAFILHFRCSLQANCSIPEPIKLLVKLSL